MSMNGSVGILPAPGAAIFPGEVVAAPGRGGRLWQQAG